MLRLLKYLKPFIPLLLVAIVLLCGQAASELALPGYMSDIVDNGVVNKDVPYILRIGGIMLLIAFLGTAASVLVSYCSGKISAGFCRNLRKMVFAKVESFSGAELDNFSTASLITRTTNDITQIQNLIFMMIRFLFFAPLMGVGGIVNALKRSASMSWIIALAVIVIIGLVVVVFAIAMPKFKIVQKLIDRLNLVTRENLAGILVVRAFNTQNFEEKRFDKSNKDLTNTNLFINRIMVVMMPMMMLVMNLLTVLIVWVGADYVASLQFQVGDMLAYIQYAMQIMMAFLMISVMFIMVPRASVSALRIAEVLEIKPIIKDPAKPEHFPSNVPTSLEFKNVSFRFPGAESDVLNNISFVAKPGEITAFIGSTGCGKSTLINLIPRFYDVTNGQVLINGVDIRNITLHELREKIGYVPQKATLFSGTIKSNLTYGRKDADEAELIKAADIAQASEFINSKPQTFDAEMAQGGVNVSGGQKQRLSIARALVKTPDIYLFDDAFSALDYTTDAKLRQALKENVTQSIVLIVAQRIDTIRNAQQIIVLDHGQIVGVGQHTDLMQNCEVYQEIALSQLSKEELA